MSGSILYFELLFRRESMPTNQKLRITTAGLMLAFIILSTTCYFILADLIQFPEILREATEIRFELFQENESVIVPTYYFWTMTDFILILISVLLFSLNKSRSSFSYMALTCGIISGVFQIVGFIRWVVFIPILSNLQESSSIPLNMVSAIESLANGYLGMTLGEHMGNFFFAFWLYFISSTLQKSARIHVSIAILGKITGVLFGIFSFVSLSPIFSFLSHGTVAAWTLVYSWMFMVAVSLIKTQSDNAARKLHWGFGWVFPFFGYQMLYPVFSKRMYR
jgi:hypothetical protein